MVILYALISQTGARPGRRWNDCRAPPGVSRTADDFATIRARMKELQRERETPPKHDGTTWRVRRVEEITKVAQEKTRELLRRA